MEISERFHYHQQILEKMVATHAKSVQESPRRAQPDSSAEMGSPLDTERDDASRDDLVDGELEEMLTSDGLAPELDNGVEEADGGGRSLRYCSIDHSVHVLPWDGTMSVCSSATCCSICASSHCRSLQSHEIETQKSLRMSTELLDLDEALSFLEEVATNPDKIPTTASVPHLEKWKSSPAPSPEPHRVCDD